MLHDPSMWGPVALGPVALVLLGRAVLARDAAAASLAVAARVGSGNADQLTIWRCCALLLYTMQRYLIVFSYTASSLVALFACCQRKKRRLPADPSVNLSGCLVVVSGVYLLLR